MSLKNSRKKRHLLPFVVIIETVIAYQWLEYTDRYHCVVSVVVNGKATSVGVFISTRTVLTSANPLNSIESDVSKVVIHYISKIYNESYGAPAVGIASDQSYRSQRWVSMGPKGSEHTSTHDIALVTIGDPIHPLLNRRIRGDELDKKRRPYPVSLPTNNYKLPSEFVYVGFGYLDEEHVKNNTALEVSYFTSDLLQNCDEWIPREWGRFICVLEVENELALASGSPLLENRNMETVYGIGCFTLRKGKENLHVFTDIKPYVDYLDGLN